MDYVDLSTVGLFRAESAILSTAEAADEKWKLDTVRR